MVSEDQRSPAPTAFEVREQQDEMIPDGAIALSDRVNLCDQTSLPWPDEFPRKLDRNKSSDDDRAGGIFRT
jgi:hypothetical protein